LKRFLPGNGISFFPGALEDYYFFKTLDESALEQFTLTIFSAMKWGRLLIKVN